jgi:hypothetical protein
MRPVTVNQQADGVSALLAQAFLLTVALHLSPWNETQSQVDQQQ